MSLSEITEVKNKWKRALESGNPDTIVSLYHNDAILWGTISATLKSTPEKIREYFEIFSSFKNIEVNFSESKYRVYDDFAIDSGYYTFSWIENENKIEIPARYSFIFRKLNDRWLILDHHSSIIPEFPFDKSKFIK